MVIMLSMIVVSGYGLSRHNWNIDVQSGTIQTASMNANGNNFHIDFSKPIGVLGVGVEGRATIDYLLRENAKEIVALDRNEITPIPPDVTTVFGDDHDQGLERFATIFRSPSVRIDHPSLLSARKNGSLVTSAISHFVEQCTAPVVGVTGTVGKGTTASLVAKMLEQSGLHTHLGGNIGSSPLAFIHQIRPEHRVVLEISSFQAIDIAKAPRVSVILKTTSEHLDWHTGLQEYRAAKAELVRLQKEDDIVVYNADSPGSTEIAHSGRSRKLAYSLLTDVEEGIFVRQSRFILRQNGQETALPLDLQQVRLPGRFNLENIAAAILAALSLGGTVETVCRVGQEFEGLPHRLEFVAEGAGIRFYNDSYATRPDAALGALSCFDTDPLALILGGSEKHADFEELARAVQKNPCIRHVALIGATSKRLAQSLTSAGPSRFSMAEYDDLEPAMEGAVHALQQGGVVLLAPACASFGLFPNYKVRGERFRTKAADLAKKLS
jgi:UDP-N-acetylmuramoylalanine--D-glutamate ligase